jgi:hypothetical protein
MKKIITFIVLILVVILGVKYFIKGMSPVSETVTPTSTTTPISNLQLLKYTASTFEISYPQDFRIDTLTSENNVWYGAATSTGKILVKFTLPKTIEPNTNFSEASLVVATSTPSVCKEKPQGAGSTLPQQVTINGLVFDKYNFSDAGAGNLYETTSYRTLSNGNCYAIEYTIHSTNIGNYSPDQGISEFNKTKIVNLLEESARSFKILK